MMEPILKVLNPITKQNSKHTKIFGPAISCGFDKPVKRKLTFIYCVAVHTATSHTTLSPLQKVQN